MERVASQVAVAVDNALNLDSSQAYQTQLARERDRLQVLLEVNNVLVTSLEAPRSISAASSTLSQRVIHHDYTSLALLDSQTGLLKIHALDFPGHQGLFKQEITVPRETSPSGHAIAEGQPIPLARRRTRPLSRTKSFASSVPMAPIVCCVPLINHGRPLALLTSPAAASMLSLRRDVELLQQVASQIAIAVENALAFKEIDALKNKLAEEKLYLEEEIRSEFNFEEIIGDSPALKRALSQLELAAPAGHNCPPPRRNRHRQRTLRPSHP